MVTSRPETTPSSVIAAWCGLVLYLLVASRLVYRILTSGVNASARSFLLGVVITSVLLVAVGGLMAWTNRKKPQWPIVLLASCIIGTVMCLVFFGA